MAEQSRAQNDKSTESKSSKDQVQAKPGAVGQIQAALAVRRAQVAPSNLTAADVMQLQRTIGNQATGRLLQAKLKLGPAVDPDEQETDRTAQQVVRSLTAPPPPVQREENDEAAPMQVSRFADSIADLQRRDKREPKQKFVLRKIQRAYEEDEDIQAKPLTVSPAGDAVIQRAWHTFPLDYTAIDQEKGQGQIRTKAWKRGGSLKEWVGKFHSALVKRSERDALVALNGLKARLESDQQLAVQGKLKAPKGVKNFNVGAAQQNAVGFFAKWILSVQEHIDYANTTGDWMTDFREKYINEPMGATLTPKEAVLNNLANVDQATPERVQAVGRMWDLGGMPMRQRMTDVMGGVSDLPRMSGMEYFLEQVSPIHVGYSRALNMFDMWMQGVLYHNWVYPWETWMPTKSGENQYGEERIIDSYDPITRAQYQLTPNGKRIVKADTNPLIGDNIYVLTKDNVWYGGAKDGPVHHSSFMQGAPVKCAGHLHTDNSGNLTGIDTSSGHYAPDMTALRRAAAVLKSQMDVSDVQVADFRGGGQQSLDNFLRG